MPSTRPLFLVSLLVLVVGCSKARKPAPETDPCAACKAGRERCGELDGGAMGCLPRKKIGEACSVEEDCIDSSCGPKKVCIAGLDVGQRCDDEVSCKQVLACLADVEGTPPRCHAPAATGARCVLDTRRGLTGMDNCAKDAFCDRTKRLCTTKGAEKAPCAEHRECASTSCLNGHCLGGGGGGGIPRPHPL